jgi:tRNA pseudouridine55 synthase
MNAPRAKRLEVNGWVVLDKPVGMTSTYAVSEVRRLFQAKKAGHAGTLDPLASGLLPIAFGEATKTVPFIQDGEKTYRFTVRWGVETDSDDADGRPTHGSERRPAPAEIQALLPRFTGTILQRPPSFSAIKVAGERAYDLARDGEAPVLEPREVRVDALALVSTERDEATFEARCGKGTYVRAIARDLGRGLGCFGHVCALRRTRVGPFAEADARLPEALRRAQASGEAALLPVSAGLLEIPAIVIDRDAAARLRRGQSILMRGNGLPFEGAAYATCGSVPIAIGAIDGGELVPSRVFNLPF